MPIQSVAIAGAGIAGLTAALCLAKAGIRSEIFEQADALKEVGAGLQVSPNAARVLDRIGVLAPLRKIWTEPVSIDLRSGVTLETLVSLPLETAETRWKAPYGVVHRASLHGVLVEAVQANPLCALTLGRRLEPKSADDIIRLCPTPPDAIIGADGVWSRCRALVPGAPKVHFTGNVAWRVVVPFAAAPDILPRDRVVAFMGPGAHLVCYPLKDGGGFNLVAITGGADPGENWSVQGEPKRAAMLRAHFARWHPGLRALLEENQSLLYWPLCEADQGSWQNGRDTLLMGDAAHAMTPFMAQGAAMAVEDAESLARHLASASVPVALHAYEAERKPRVKRLRDRGDFNRRVYHARGPLQFGRDLVMALRPSRAYLADLDWIYGYGT